MKNVVFFLCVFVEFCLTAQTPFKIAFGSCSHQDKPLLIFNEIALRSPNLFIFLGDNIYGDTKNGLLLKKKYARLAKKSSFIALKQKTQIIATWDDHDFGKNDAGKEFIRKTKFKKLFLDFFDEPKKSLRREQQGIYTSYNFLVDNQIIQVVLLDTRTFRDKLLLINKAKSVDTLFKYQLDYIPHTEKQASFLGEKQWSWLKIKLLEEADYRIICSSTQFGISYNGYEAWANFPHERERMTQLIEETKAKGLVFISGDVHYAEISRLELPLSYPIYDITSSGLSQTWHFATPNSNRIDGPFMGNNFGLINIDTGARTMNFEIIDANGIPQITRKISLEELQFKE